MFRSVALVCCVSAAALLLSGCGTSTSTSTTTTTTTTIIGTCAEGVSHCQYRDVGSCGNACCKVLSDFEAWSPETIAQMLTESLAAGGPDGQFSLPELFQGMSGFNNMNGTYLGQALHTNSGPDHYEEVVNILIETIDDTSGWPTKVNFFSTSLTAGVLNDHGQNWKNCKMLVDIVIAHGSSSHGYGTVGGSCGDLNTDPITDQSPPRKLSTVHDVRTSIDGTCGLKEEVQPVGCKNVDYGHCGNACCSIAVIVAESAAATVALLADSLADGGPDGFFTMKTIHGTPGFANFNLPAADARDEKNGYRQFCDDGTRYYTGQVDHMTNGGKYLFNDTVNFNICEQHGTTTVHAFSLSLIGGAYGDWGQNYKNIKMVFDAAFPGGWQRDFDYLGALLGTCPEPKTEIMI